MMIGTDEPATELAAAGLRIRTEDATRHQEPAAQLQPLIRRLDTSTAVIT
jgi:hypothetical protein